MGRESESDRERERGTGGEYVQEISLAAVLGVFAEVRGPVVLTGDVMDVLGCGRETARQKLTRLADQGRIERRKKGRTIVWWRTPSDAADQRLKRLSTALDQPIVVGNSVYEDGEEHPLLDAADRVATHEESATMSERLAEEEVGERDQ